MSVSRTQTVLLLLFVLEGLSNVSVPILVGLPPPGLSLLNCALIVVCLFVVAEVFDLQKWEAPFTQNGLIM